MAKGGKLMKLKSMIKKVQSISKLGRTNGSSIAAANPSDDGDDCVYSDKIPGGFQPVYVGKSRRRYLISSDVLENPLFRVLVDKSGVSDSVTVRCEVVLFEHMLWMLANADPQPESLDELVEFYAC